MSPPDQVAKSTKLPAAMSDAALQFHDEVEVVRRASEVLGIDRVAGWMRTRIPSLGNQTPYALIQTRVASATMSISGYNYILNPAHPEFARISFSFAPFSLDPRLRPRSKEEP